MERMRSLATACVLLLLTGAGRADEPDPRAQMPALLRDTYFRGTLGHGDEPFSSAQLQPGFRADSVHVPSTAARVMLIGHEFNRFLSAEASYMRPVSYVTYTGLAQGGV